MNNYEVTKVDIYNTADHKMKPLFQIIEKATGYKVFESWNKRKTYKHLAHLNMGGCFDGWTPSFFLTEIPENNYEDGE